jgi:hypothetical protein
MRPTAILRGAAAALVVSLAMLSTASANGRGGHAPAYGGIAPRMHGGVYRHGGLMRPPMHGMHWRHGYRHRHLGHHGYGHHRHHGRYIHHRKHHDGFAGRLAFFPRPAYHRHGYHGGNGFFPRPRLRRPVYGGPGRYHGYGYRRAYVVPSFARPAYYPYTHSVSHGYGAIGYGYGYGYYPSIGFGTVAGASLYAPLYNRPACLCY